MRFVTRLASLVTVVALCAGCVLPADSSEATIDTAADVGNWEDPWGDGLARVVVRWLPDGVSASDSADPSGGLSALRAQAFEPVDPDHPLAGTGGGNTGGSGSGDGSTDRAPETTTTTTTTIPEPVAGDHPLLSEPGVVEVNPIRDDLYQVVTELDDERVAALPGVVQAWNEPIASTSTDPEQNKQWYLANDGRSAAGGTPGADAGVVDAWERSTGSGIVVAVIDTGVQVDHPDLVDRIWRNDDEICGNRIDDDRNGYVDDCQGWDFTDEDGVVVDTNGHGTHIAGTIAAEADNGLGIAGVAPDARIMPVRISTGSSFGLSVTVRAIDYAVENGADILNLSWGTAPGTPINAFPPLSDAIERARQAGVLVMIAAGNSSANIDDRPVIPASYPHDNVVTVAASTSSDGRASFTNFGVRTVEIFAPGHNIFATVPGSGYGWKSGTSMATPVTAGVAAVLWAADPSAPYTEVRDALFDGATRIPAFGPLSTTGARSDAADSLADLSPAVRYEVGGLGDLRPGTHTLDIRTSLGADANVPTEDLALRTTLLAIYDDQVYGLTGHAVTMNGVDTVSDDSGQLMTPPSDSVPTSVLLGLDLPVGEYGLLLELVSTTNGVAEPVGPGGLLGFAVAEPSAPTTSAPGTPAPTTTQATPVAPGTPSPTTTTSLPGSNPTNPTSTVAPGTPTPAPTTVAPGTPTPTTVAPGTPTPAPTTVAPGTPTTVAPSPTRPTRPNPPSTIPTRPNPPSTIPDRPEAVGDLILTGLNPRSGSTAGGDLVTITGTDLGNRPSVRFGDRGAQVVAVIAGVQLVVISPPGTTGTVDVTVSSRGRTGTLLSAYTYTDGQGPSAPTTSAVVSPTPTTVAPGTPTPTPTTVAPGTPTPTPTTVAPGTPTPTPTTVAPGTPTTTPGSPTPTTSPGTPGTPTPTTVAPGTPTTTPGSPTPTTSPGTPGTPTPTSEQVAPTSTAPSRLTTPDGLELRPISDALGGRSISAADLRAAMCTTSSCEATTA